MSIFHLSSEGKDEVSEYVVKIDFQRKSEQPTRVFKAMAEIIDTLYKIDMDLAKSFFFFTEIKPRLILDDIEVGSLKARLCTIIKALDDDGIRELNLKKIVGSFLLKAKYRILKFLEDKREISNIEQVQELENEILSSVKEVNINILPVYIPVPMQKLLEHLVSLSNATNYLSPQDIAFYVSNEGEVKINPVFTMSMEGIQNLLTKETLISQSEMILRVKKPDYLGLSMWDVHYKGRTISVKVLDLEWLERFQSRKIDVRPGDSLRAIVRSEVKYDYKNNVVAEHYSIEKVLDVMRMESIIQQTLFPYEDSGNK